MRVRKKKNGQERIDACSDLLIKNVEELRDGFGAIFGNDRPVHLEIGCGKGNFAVGMAKANSDVNFVAMEKVADVCCIALEKAMATKDERQGDNLRFLIGDAKTLEENIPESSLDCIYLNFSDPWPKSGHAKRRLTHRGFLSIYARALKADGILRFKTDNVGLFDFSLEEFEAFGAEIIWQTRDLHSSEKSEGNVMTEYEKNFSEKGFNICSAWVKLPKKEVTHFIRDTVRESRSQRSFVPDRKIPHDVLMTLCDTARICPAAMNLQVLKYKVVEDKEMVAALVGATRWATALDKKLPPEGHGPSAFIVICHDTSIAERKPIFTIDVGIAAQTIMLSACEMGYGGCIIGSGNEKTIAEIIGLPAHLEVALVIGLGVPEETVVLTDVTDGQVKYYRDENDTHFVPKRPLDEIIIK